MRTILFVVLVASLCVGTICGCGGPVQQPSTEQDKTSFKGGPMPPGYMEKLNAKMAAGQKSVQENAAKAQQKAINGATATTTRR